MSVMTTAEKASYDALVSGAAQAVKKDGTVAFTAAQPGVTATAAASLTIRSDVDQAIVSVSAATTAALPAYTIISGTLAGGDAVIEASANGAFPSLDAFVTIAAAASGEPVSSRFLLQNGASTVDNGVWCLTVQGSGGTKWRAAMYTGLNTAAKIVGSQIRVQNGQQSGGGLYMYKAVAAITVGTTALFWKRVDARMGPNEGIRWYDTMVDANTPVNATTIGPSGWRFIASGSGSAIVTTTANTATLVGAFTISSGTTTTGFGGLESSFIGGTADGGWTMVPGVNVDYEFEARIAAPVLSTGAQEFAINCGFSKQRATSQKTPADGILFVYDRTSGTSALNWLAVCSTSSTATTVDTGVVVTAAQYYRLKIVHDAGDSTVRFYIDGALVASISTNVPTGVVLGGLVDGLKNVGITTTSMLGCDWIGLDVFYPQRLAA